MLSPVTGIGDQATLDAYGRAYWQQNIPGWTPPQPYQVPPKRCTCKTCPCCGGQIPMVAPWTITYGQLTWNG